MLLDVQASSREEIPEVLERLGQDYSKMQTLVVFYALLYVVVEGYRESNLQDNDVEALLSEGDYEVRLKRFRNAVFHYQSDPFDKRLLEFLEAEDGEIWVRRLHAAVDNFLTRSLRIKETVESWKKLDEPGIATLVATRRL